MTLSAVFVLLLQPKNISQTYDYMMRIDHLALYCTDLEGMKGFFVKHFQATSNDMYHNPRTSLRTYILSFPDGDTRLELMTRPEVDCGDGNQYRSGFIHVSFAAGSREAVDAITARLSAEGYPTLSGPRTTGDGYYESCVKGPEGILLEITV